MPALSKRQRILAYRREEAWILAKKTNRPAYVAVNKARGDTRVIQTEGDAFPAQEEWIVREVITPSEARKQLAPPSLRHYYDERENLRGACTLHNAEGQKHRARFAKLTEIIGDDEPTPQPHPLPESKPVACYLCGSTITQAEAEAARWICPSCGRDMDGSDEGVSTPPKDDEESRVITSLDDDDRSTSSLEEHQSLPTDNPNWPGEEELDYLANGPGLEGPPHPIGVEDNPHVFDPEEESTGADPAFDWPETGKLSTDQANTIKKWRERTEREDIPFPTFTPREMNAYTSPVRALVKKGLLIGRCDEAGENIMDRHYRPATKRDMERLAAEDRAKAV